MYFKEMLPFWLLVILAGSLIWLSDIDANDINSKNIFIKTIAQEQYMQDKQDKLKNNKKEYHKLSQIFKD